LPDFRTGERTYQLLTQVAGRAGRSLLGGKVIIQTYNPEHYAVEAARDQDYGAFFRKELAYRGEHGYPPYNQLARLVYAHPVEEKGRAESERLSRALRQRVSQLGLANCQVLGPAPAYVSRLRGRYRWQLVVRAEDVHPLLSETPIPPGWVVDVDPVSLL
ncbi:MAG: primosomal protein N', partial [Chloroflexi bacterium]|nr:primosomal protein N' [Chloroflexota bacterium]